MFKHRCRALVCLAGIALVFACAGPSTTIEQSWTAPQFSPPRRLVVVYISHDGSVRRTVEDEMVAKLARNGISAAPSYSVVTNDVLQDPTRSKAMMRSAGFDGVIAIRLLSKDSDNASSFGDYWTSAWSAYDSAFVVRLETSLYSLETGELLWSAMSRTLDPDNNKTVINEVTSVVSQQLHKSRVVVGTR
jgi:hypothetical protein